MLERSEDSVSGCISTSFSADLGGMVDSGRSKKRASERMVTRKSTNMVAVCVKRPVKQESNDRRVWTWPFLSMNGPSSFVVVVVEGKRNGPSIGSPLARLMSDGSEGEAHA